jgi:hypothetical protein
VPWSQAKQLDRELTAEAEEHERVDRKRREEQMDAARDARMWPVTAFELAKTAGERRVVGVQAFGPDDPEPGWAQGASVEVEESWPVAMVFKPRPRILSRADYTPCEVHHASSVWSVGTHRGWLASESLPSTPARPPESRKSPGVGTNPKRTGTLSFLVSGRCFAVA